MHADWSGGREAEGGGLLNRCTVEKPYRGFESLPLRQPAKDVVARSAIPHGCTFFEAMGTASPESAASYAAKKRVAKEILASAYADNRRWQERGGAHT